MATINNIADLVKVLQDNPEWLLTICGLIISKEIADLPSSVEELKATVDRMSDTLTTRLDNVSSMLTTVSSRVDNLTGADYQGQAAHFGRRRLRDTLQVEDVQLMYQYRRQGEAKKDRAPALAGLPSAPATFQARATHGALSENPS